MQGHGEQNQHLCNLFIHVTKLNIAQELESFDLSQMNVRLICQDDVNVSGHDEMHLD